MTAAQIQPASLQPPGTSASAAVDPTLWVEADVAAEILGKTPRRLRQLCIEKLHGQHLAVFGKSPHGGQDKWWVSRSMDQRLAPGDVGALFQVPVHELERFPKAGVEKAWERAACVEEFRAARSTWKGDLSTWLPGFLQSLQARHSALKISRTTLYAWNQAYQTPSDIVKLIDTRGGNQRGNADPAAWKAFQELFLDERQPTIKSCWQRTREMAQANKWMWCSYKQCQRQLDQKIAPELQAFHRKPKQYLKHFQPTIPQDPNTWLPGLRWEGDHRQSNCWVLFGPAGRQKPVRPWFTAWVDTATDRITGRAIAHSPSSTTILAALRQGLLDPINCGGPDQVKIDNGKDYDCYTFQGKTKHERKKLKLNGTELGLFQMLAIGVDHALPHNPNGKPHVERLFETLEDFDKSFVSYCGRKSEDCPPATKELLQRENWHKLPTMEHYVQRLNAYLDGLNAATGEDLTDYQRQKLQGLSRDQAVAQLCPRRKALPAAGVLDLLLQKWHRAVRVVKQGIPLHAFGLTLHYGGFDPRLISLKPGVSGGGVAGGRSVPGSQVIVAHDPYDLSRIRAYDLQHRAIGDFWLNGFGGQQTPGDSIAEQQVKDLIARKRRYFKALREVKEGRNYEYETPAESIARQKADETARLCAQAGQGQPLKIIQTPLDTRNNGQAKPLRQAVGADLAADAIGGDMITPRLHELHIAGEADADLPPQPVTTFADLKISTDDTPSTDGSVWHSLSVPSDGGEL